jgi:hypothetical protein
MASEPLSLLAVYLLRLWVDGEGMGQRRELLEWMEKGHCNWRL